MNDNQYIARYIGSIWWACRIKNGTIINDKYNGCINCCPPHAKISQPSIKKNNLFNGKVISGDVFTKEFIIHNIAALAKQYKETVERKKQERSN